MTDVTFSDLLKLKKQFAHQEIERYLVREDMLINHYSKRILMINNTNIECDFYLPHNLRFTEYAFRFAHFIRFSDFQKILSVLNHKSYKYISILNYTNRYINIMLWLLDNNYTFDRNFIQVQNQNLNVEFIPETKGTTSEADDDIDKNNISKKELSDIFDDNICSTCLNQNLINRFKYTVKQRAILIKLKEKYALQEIDRYIVKDHSIIDLYHSNILPYVSINTRNLGFFTIYSSKFTPSSGFFINLYDFKLILSAIGNKQASYINVSNEQNIFINLRFWLPDNFIAIKTFLSGSKSNITGNLIVPLTERYIVTDDSSIDFNKPFFIKFNINNSTINKFTCYKSSNPDNISYYVLLSDFRKIQECVGDHFDAWRYEKYADKMYVNLYLWIKEHCGFFYIDNI